MGTCLCKRGMGVWMTVFTKRHVQEDLWEDY